VASDNRTSSSSLRSESWRLSFGNGCGARNFPGVYTEANSEEIRPFIYRAAEN